MARSSHPVGEPSPLVAVPLRDVEGVSEGRAYGSHTLTMDSKHRYTCACAGCNGKVYRSVTTILGQSVPKDFGVAAWYGQTIGVAGTLTLLERDFNLKGLDPQHVVKLLTTNRLTVNHTKQKAADRGTAVHAALEAYATEGTIPTPSHFPEADRGYVRGLAKFITEHKPEFVASEVQVLSTEHSYAGTFDLLAWITFNGERRFSLLDLKTSKWVYPTSHFPQLEAYEGARVEAGETPTDLRAVLWITAEGRMEVVPSTATFDDFLALRRSAEVLQRLEASYKRPRGKS
jgi:hypothetical protein